MFTFIRNLSTEAPMSQLRGTIKTFQPNSNTPTFGFLIYDPTEKGDWYVDVLKQQESSATAFVIYSSSV
ncbi:MAG: hypothetical protein RR975_05970 [Clostridia bacterium]